MALKLRILGSSSSGNCALLSTPTRNMLVDAGIRINCLKKLLIECGLCLEQIDAVFLTHEHTDHTVALPYFRDGCQKIPIFANRATAAHVQRRCKQPLNWQVFETGDSWAVGDLEVQSFPLPHDASDPVGFVFSSQGAAEVRKLGWITDLGYVTELVRQKVRDVDMLALESNYEKHLLDNHPTRPLALKQRVAGRHGHLSNEDAFTLLDSVEMPRCRHVLLIHISKECNTEEEAVRRFAQGALLRSFTIETVNPHVVGLRPVLELD